MHEVLGSSLPELITIVSLGKRPENGMICKYASCGSAVPLLKICMWWSRVSRETKGSYYGKGQQPAPHVHNGQKSKASSACPKWPKKRCDFSEEFKEAIAMDPTNFLFENRLNTTFH